MTANLIVENGLHGLKAVVTSSWSKEILDEILDKGIVELELNDGKGWRGGNIDFLANLPTLLSFEITDLRISSIKPVHFLKKIRYLKVFTYCKTEIIFSYFLNMTKCMLEWRPKAQSIFDSIELQEIFINRYDGKDSGGFGKLTNLRALTILNSPIEHLGGLRTLKKLEFLRLGNLKRLRSLAGIEGLLNIRELEINTCRKLISVKEIGSMLNIKTLRLNNNGNIESFAPLENLTKLESFTFYDSTNVIDGDLYFLIRMPKISRLSFENRRHYSHKREDFIAFKGNDK